MSLAVDVPVFVSSHTTYYSWEGNPVNLSCGVQSHPPAVLLWQRDRLTVGTATEGPGNARVYNAEGRSLLEVPSHTEALWETHWRTVVNVPRKC